MIDGMTMHFNNYLDEICDVGKLLQELSGVEPTSLAGEKLHSVLTKAY